MNKMSVVLAALCLGLNAWAGDGQRELYYAQLESLQVPRALLDGAIKARGPQAALVDSQIFVEVSRNGEMCWRSPGRPVDASGRQERFSFDEKDRLTSFALTWKSGDEIDIAVRVAESKALVRASTAGGGAVAGMLAGAAVGAIGAGCCTGGLGAPAGALIGGGIGLFGGAAIAQFVPVKGAREVVNFKTNAEDFGLNGELEKDVSSTDDILLSGKAKIKFKGYKRTDKVESGKLQLQKKYLVRLRSVYLDGNEKKVKQGAKYYMELRTEGEDKPIKIDLGHLPAYTLTGREDFVVLKNIGGVSSCCIKRKITCWPDPTVFECKQGGTNGTSWVFMGKLANEVGSYVEFDTFPTED